MPNLQVWQAIKSFSLLGNTQKWAIFIKEFGDFLSVFVSSLFLTVADVTASNNGTLCSSLPSAVLQNVLKLLQKVANNYCIKSILAVQIHTKSLHHLQWLHYADQPVSAPSCDSVRARCSTPSTQFFPIHTLCPKCALRVGSGCTNSELRNHWPGRKKTQHRERRKKKQDIAQQKRIKSSLSFGDGLQQHSPHSNL